MDSMPFQRRFQEFWLADLGPETRQKRTIVLAFEESHDLYVNCLKLLAQTSCVDFPDGMTETDVAQLEDLVNLLASIFDDSGSLTPCTNLGPYVGEACAARLRYDVAERVREELKGQNFCLIIVRTIAPAGLTAQASIMFELDPNEPADRRVSELLLIRLDQATDDKLEIIKESPERYWYFLRRLRLIAELSLVHTPEAVTTHDIDRMVGLINEIYLHGLYSNCTGW